MHSEICSALQADKCFNEWLRLLPTAFDHMGEVVFSGRNQIRKTAVRLGDGSMTEVVVKCYRVPHFFQRIAYSWLIATKARRAYFNAWQLNSRHIDTPEALAYTECRVAGWLGYSFLLTKVDDQEAIVGMLRMDDAFDRPFATALAAFFARLHDRGVIHQDLNNTNIRFSRKEDGTYSFSLIDINRMTFFCPNEAPPLRECLRNLTLYWDLSPMYSYVAHEYIRLRGLPEETYPLLIRIKKAHDRHWRHKKALSHLWHQIVH